MRSECVSTMEELAMSDPRVVVIASDPGPDFMVKLAAKYPERLMIEGICEQGLIGMAAGLSEAGYYPYIVTLAVFATRRCYEQLLLDFSLHQFSGCIVGNGGGLAYSLMGPTHIAVDDLMLISAIPGSAILSPADPNEAILLTKQARAFSGLSYMRLAATTDSLKRSRGGVVLGKGRLLAEPGPVLFISCGAATLAVESAVALLKETGIQAGILHLHTVKPLDVDLVRHSVAGSEVVLCVEEHRQVGGLSSAVLHALTSAEPPITPVRFASVGLDDTFPFGYGTYEDLMDRYGLTGPQLAARARALLANSRSTTDSRCAVEN